MNMVLRNLLAIDHDEVSLAQQTQRAIDVDGRQPQRVADELLSQRSPPLLVWSRPGLAFVWAFPARARKPIGAADGAAAWGLALLQDQQLAGVIMWVSAGLAYVAAAAWVFVQWLREGERRASRISRQASAAAASVSMLAVALLCCSGSGS